MGQWAIMPSPPSGTPTFHLTTLGCPKNQVDSDKLAGTLLADGLVEAPRPEDADLVVVNTCAFIEEAREESIDTILQLAQGRRHGARLVVTGCLAERYGEELAAELPEVDLVAGFGQPVNALAEVRSGQPEPGAVRVEIGRRVPGSGTRQPRDTLATRWLAAPPQFDLLNLPRPPVNVPWAYVKVAEGCDRACGYCAIPSFRGPQRSRSIDAICAEVEALDVQEVVLVAQDLASFGRDRGEKAIVPLVQAVSKLVERTRLLYLYPSDLTDELIDAVCATGVPYFDLSLQHASRPLLRRMRRWGDGERFLRRIGQIRAREPDAAFRSNFIVGYPGETEEDHDALLRFVEQARLDWCGFFRYSEEEGTYARALAGRVPPGLVDERLAELRELQDQITAAKRDEMLGRTVQVLVDTPGIGRTHREAPEIDGVIHVPGQLPPGTFHELIVVGSAGPDLDASFDRE